MNLFTNENYKIEIKTSEAMKIIKPKLWEHYASDFNQIAFDSGYLTMDIEEKKYFLKIPNQEIRNCFSDMIKNCMFNVETYSNLMENLIFLNFKEFFDKLEKITFANGMILNLIEINEESRNQANYEAFLHQACSIALYEMLIESKDSKDIIDFDFLNEEALENGRLDTFFKIK